MTEDSNTKRTKYPRAGHRRNIREAYQKHGMDALKKYEILEFILFHAIPLRDTQKYGRDLIDRYEKISAALDADIEELQQTDGIGANSAVLLKLMPELARRYIRKENEDAPCLDSKKSVEAYLEGLFENQDKTLLYMVCLDVAGRVIRCVKLGEYDSDLIQVDRKAFILAVAGSQAANVVIAHNHPQGSSLPSDNDRLQTAEFANILKSLNVRFIDHVIFSKGTPHFMSNSSSSYSIFFRM